MSVFEFIKRKLFGSIQSVIPTPHFHLDRIFRIEYQNTPLDRVLINGWFHNGINASTPNIKLYFNGNFISKIPLNQKREDVKKIFGDCYYDNGFITILGIPAEAKTIEIKESGSILFQQSISELDIEELSDYDYRTQKAIQDIPIELRRKIAQKFDNFEVDSGGGTYQSTYHFLVKYFLRPKIKEKGFNIFGNISGVFGLSEAARAYIDSLFESKEEFVLVDYAEPSHVKITDEEEKLYITRYYQPFKYDTNVFLLDAAILGILIDKCPQIFENKRNVISFWWEFETGFEDSIPLLNKFDEILVFSDFIKEVLKKIPNRRFKVSKIKYPFYAKWEIEENTSTIKSKYGLDNKFCFFFNFDYASGYNRKNPEASLKAFFEEFENQDDVLIVYKTNSNNTHTEKVEKFNELIEQYQIQDKVVLLDESFSKNGIMTILNAMNCYVSLHRGEGLGLGILEALHLEIPVIATNYGGNTEYMNHKLAHPVSYQLIPAFDDYHIYKDVKEWAEPNHEVAKKLMRQVYNEARR